MSGGHLDYQHYRIEDIAREIQHLIESNDDDSIDEFDQRRGYCFPPEIIARFDEAVYTLNRAGVKNRVGTEQRPKVSQSVPNH